ncbi:MAG: galactosamine-6-phosphate isomerase [Mucilaginibacter sp.]|nr:galactosamine-6-phosphate isomerase [Mucilaginibacter sp.]
MQIIRCTTLAELNERASDLLIEELKQNPQSLVCAATGNSPTGAYQKLAEKQGSIIVENLTFIKLDEWYGLGPDDAGSCDYYLHKYLLQPLEVSAERYIAFNGKTDDPEKECSRIAKYLDEHGPIDICILGLGANGHIAFNEPADKLQPRAHLGTLSETSLTHTMVMDSGAVVKYGLTLGMADILRSRRIVLLVNGTHKNAVMEKLLEQKISTQLPASFLWLHPDVQWFYCDNDN